MSGTSPPEITRVHAISTTRERLESLMGEIINRKLSVACYDLMRYLAYMTPFRRLEYNIRTTLWLMGYRLKITQTDGEDCTSLNILIDGLTHEERLALMEIDASGASLEARRTAHSLLDVDVRQKIAQQLGGTFKDRWERVRHKLIDRPLDSTVNVERT